MPSSKLRKFQEGDEVTCSLDMSPMIDMVFLLLIFFIVNATAIIVKTDPNVTPPVAKNAMAQKNREGRIVINVRQDGSFTNEQFMQLPDENAIYEVIERERADVENRGLTPKLHLRGDQQSVFRYSKVAIRAAARAKVNEVVFAVYTTGDKNGD